VFQENGAHARTAELLDFLGNTFERVVLYSYRDHPSCPWTAAAERTFRERYPAVELVLEDRAQGLTALSRFRNAVLQLAPRLSTQATRWCSTALAPRYRALLDSLTSPCVLFVSYVDGISQLPYLPEQARIVVETHDLKFLSYAKTRGDAASSVRTLAKLRGELSAISLADAVVAISPFEAQLYAALSPATKVFYIPRYVAPPRAEAAFSPSTLDYELLFVGSENRLNVDGLLSFLAEQRALFAGRKLAVCGRMCAEPKILAAAAAHPEIELLGYVGDLAGPHARSRICLAPVEGTGLKIKILDALRYGRPVLASASAIAGLPPGHEGCVFPLGSDHAERLVRDDAYWKQAARAAHDYSARLLDLGDLRALRAFVANDSQTMNAAPARPHAISA
jgi:glycosyltransferase involved in cell wall biosynthesis